MKLIEDLPTQQRILVVDDEKRLRDVVSTTLKREGFIVETAVDGEDALIRAKEFRPDLILLDVMMPKLDGLSVCKKLQENPEHKDCAIIMVTAKGDLASKVEGLGAGAWDYLSKPYQIPELVSRAKATLRVKHLQDELRRVNRIKDEFLAIAAHDLRSPLTSLILWGQFLQEFKVLTPDIIKKASDNIVKISYDMLQLINDLLDTAKLELGKLELHPKPYSIKQLFEEMHDKYKMIAGQHNVSITYSIEGDLPSALMDEVRMREVLGNLIDNALKFTPAGGNIYLKASPFSPEQPKIAGDTKIRARAEKNKVGKYILIDVSDTGSGIPPENLEVIFDRFVQFEKRSEKKSTGLGLAICREIVELHGGQIWAENKSSGGACFRILFPIIAPSTATTTNDNLIQ